MVIHKNDESLLSKYVKIFGVVALYWFTSILTVFVNKALLSSDTMNLDAPLFVTWIQCIVSVALSMLLRTFQKSKQPTASVFSMDIAAKVLPLSILFTAMIATNNLCLKYVDVSFYYIGRSLTTVFNVILSYALLRQTCSFRCILCCAMIVSGFWLGVDQERIADSFSLIGTIFGVLGSISLSLCSIYTKKTLPKLDDEVLLLSYYVNVYATFIFIPLIIFTGEVSTLAHYENFWRLWFWCALLVGGLFGFSIGFVTTLQIKLTTPLTHNISGTAKACAQTVIATQWNHDSKTWLWWLSNFVVLFGSSLYARVKQLEMNQKFRKELSRNENENENV